MFIAGRRIPLVFEIKTSCILAALRFFFAALQWGKSDVTFETQRRHGAPTGIAGVGW